MRKLLSLFASLLLASTAYAQSISGIPIGPGNGGGGGGGGGGGSGTVNSGTTGQIAVYPGNGTTVGGVNTINLGAHATGAPPAIIDSQTTGSPYTVVTGDWGGLLNVTSGTAYGVTLPQAGTTGFASGWNATILNLGAGLVTMTPTTSTFNGQSAFILRQFDSIYPLSDGVNYKGPINCGSMANNVATNVLFGGAGAYECPAQVTVGSGLSLVGGVLSASAAVNPTNTISVPASFPVTASASWALNATSISMTCPSAPSSGIAPASGWSVYDITLKKTIGTASGACSGGALPISAAAAASSGASDSLLLYATADVSYTYTPTSGAKFVDIWLQAGGGGGGSGAVQASGSACSGGGGGGGGGLAKVSLPVANLPSGTLTMVVGHGGAGGAAVGPVGVATAGNVGNAGTNSYLWNGTIYAARAWAGGAGGPGGLAANSGGGGSGGSGALGGNGSTTGGAGGILGGVTGGTGAAAAQSSTGGYPSFPGGAGGGSPAAGGAGTTGGPTIQAGAGGGSGGGVTTAPAASAGGTGAGVYFAATSTGATSGGAAGTSANGGVGGTGAVATNSSLVMGGPAGAGGGSGLAGFTGGAGGVGVVGAGGGGGGCAVYTGTNTSGAGGDGGAGAGAIVEYF